MTHEIVFYRSANGDQRIEVLFRDESFWMPQKAIAELFDVQVPAISKHLKNIFESAELVEDAVVSILETTAPSKPIKPKQRRHRDPIFAPCDFSRTATLSNLETVRQAGSRHARRNLVIYNRRMIPNRKNKRNCMYQQPLPYLIAI